MIIYVDIDGTICSTDSDHNYNNSVPNKQRISKINDLYNNGNEIHYWTARGSSSGKDWYDLTVRQLNEWGCLYTTVSVGKPSYDVWIDDKALNADLFFDGIRQ